jgi:hypothetical protein
MNNKILKFFVNNWLTILLAFIPPVVITYYFQREVHQLDVVLKSNTPVVQIEERYSDGITVFYQANRIRTLNVLELAVKNSGNRPIEDNDFKQPLTFIFNGIVLPNPKLLDVVPKAVKPSLKQIKPNALELEPLLLNQGDRFSFLVYLIDSNVPGTPVDISARVSKIKEPRLRVEADYPVKRSTMAESAIWVFSVFGAGVSLTSLVLLWRRLREVTLEFSPTSGDSANIVRQSNEAQSIAKELMRELNFLGGDYKANLLLLRIKIEEQLRELAYKADIPSHLKLNSMISLARYLADRGILPGVLAGRIADVLPVINRELHANESYLSKKDLDSLQKYTLQLVGELVQLKNRQESSYKL